MAVHHRQWRRFAGGMSRPVFLRERASAWLDGGGEYATMVVMHQLAPAVAGCAGGRRVDGIVVHTVPTPHFRRQPPTSATKPPPQQSRRSLRCQHSDQICHSPQPPPVTPSPTTCFNELFSGDSVHS
ncbi:basic helix-loop-helix (bHLH) DNA-bindingsuperfamily protein [Striga asiatica]|uniref:Basic helix-loop-helix (BHLH) DNA-bindingsuperfamily protein n=1 Tax=Striga asiatica TaxID=4170 RepID=A0A5A7QMZ6_STRAF|nr:basic helix-loop-helix (bHLH) DNA-bindingsuperfamily protein [Striga asiatica]